jgi:hypothetical protein
MSLDLKAVRVYLVHRDWTKKQIATYLKCNEKSLTPKRCPQLKAAISAYRSTHLPHGSKDSNGNVEAWDDEPRSRRR